MLDWKTGSISNVTLNLLDEEPTLSLDECLSMEITINHPRTVPFKKMIPQAQRSLLTSLYYKARASIDGQILEDTVRHELCADGCYHLHGFIYLKVDKPYIPEGIVMPAARSIIHGMPKRAHQQLSGYRYCSQYKVFKSPAVCVQLTPFSDLKRIALWEQYCSKNV